MTKTHVGTQESANVVTTTRGKVVENTHIVHAAITTSNGRLVFSLGNPERLTLIRSCAKPIQALAILESGAPELYGFSDEDLALACASHNAEEAHVERARGILKKAGLQEKDLRCGGHVSLLNTVNEAWARDGIVPSAVYSNCSGKHAAMLAAAKAMSAPLENYHTIDHPVQQRIKKLVEEIAGVAPEEVHWAIDGCNMAAPAYSLHYMAKTYAAFASAADAVSINPESASPRARNMARIYDVMTKHADMVAGTTRYCTEMMFAHGGAMFGKLGADACYGIGVRESARTCLSLGRRGAVGIAVKVEDGRVDILYAALEEILEQLGLTPPEVAERLHKFHYPRLANTVGVVTGHVQCSFRLRECDKLIDDNTVAASK